jgi:hypothetical protein
VVVPVINLFAVSLAEGARTSVHVASSGEVAGLTGQYFAKSRIKQPSGVALDEEIQGRMWAVSEELVQ